MKPKLVIKAGTIIAAAMGDPNASIPTPQPVHYRPMFGAFGRALQRTSFTFLSQAGIDKGVPQALGLAKTCLPVRNVRSGISKKSMIHNDATPQIEIDPGNLCRDGGRGIAGLRAGEGAAAGATLFHVLRPLHAAFSAAPGREGVGKAAPGLGLEFRSRRGADEAGIELGADRRLVHADADEDEFLPAVAPDRRPVAVHQLAPFLVIGPAAFRDGAPPEAHGRDLAHGAGDRQFAHPIRARGQPEMALGAHQTGKGAVDEGVELLRMEGPAGAVDEARDAVFLGLGHMLGMAVELLEPERMFLRLLEIEAPGIEDPPPSARLRNRPRSASHPGLSAMMIFLASSRCSGVASENLVEHDGIGEFDLIDEEIDQRPGRLRPPPSRRDPAGNRSSRNRAGD